MIIPVKLPIKSEGENIPPDPPEPRLRLVAIILKKSILVVRNKQKLGGILNE